MISIFVLTCLTRSLFLTVFGRFLVEMARFALYQFSEEDSYEIGETEWMTGSDVVPYNNKAFNFFNFSTRVQTMWPTTEQTLKWTHGSSGKKINLKDMKGPYDALVVRFGGKLRLKPILHLTMLTGFIHSSK
jgi:hypothetical protein